MTASSAPQPPAPSPNQVEHELDLIESAIALVASGGASRVVVVLLNGDLILAAAQASARRRGVVVRSIRGSGGGCDIIVEPAG
jgi:hypothetical protein